MNSKRTRNGALPGSTHTRSHGSTYSAADERTPPVEAPSELGLGWVLLGSAALASISCAVAALIHQLF